MAESWNWKGGRFRPPVVIKLPPCESFDLKYSPCGAFPSFSFTSSVAMPSGFLVRRHIIYSFSKLFHPLRMLLPASLPLRSTPSSPAPAGKRSCISVPAGTKPSLSATGRGEFRVKTCREKPFFKNCPVGKSPVLCLLFFPLITTLVFYSLQT